MINNEKWKPNIKERKPQELVFIQIHAIGAYCDYFSQQSPAVETLSCITERAYNYDLIIPWKKTNKPTQKQRAVMPALSISVSVFSSD